MSGLGIAALVILGPVGVFLAVAIVLRIRVQRRAPDWRVTRLADLSRDDVDPHWPLVREELGPPPPSWDSCIVRDPKTPQQEGEPDDRP